MSTNPPFPIAAKALLSFSVFAGTAPMHGEIRRLSSPAFEERAEAAGRLSAEAARLEKAGKKEELSALMAALKQCAAADEDQEARAAAGRILAPLLAGNARWRKTLADLPGRVSTGKGLPEGILLSNLDISWTDNNATLGQAEPLWLGLYARDTGEAVWKAVFEPCQIMHSRMDVSDGRVLVIGNPEPVDAAGLGDTGGPGSWVRLLDLKTGRTVWEASPEKLDAFVEGGFLAGSRIVLYGKDDKGGRVWCLDTKGDPAKPLWSSALPRSFVQTVAGPAPVEWLGEPALFAVTENRVVVYRLADGKEAWARKGMGLGLSMATPAGLVLITGSLSGIFDVEEELKETMQFLSGRTGETLWEKEPPGHVFETASIEGGLWAGGDDDGNADGPWWMGLYDLATGKPRWELTGVTLTGGNLPIPHVSAAGILVGEKANPFGGGVIMRGLSLTLYSGTTGKVAWKKVLPEVDTDVTRIQLLSDGVLVFDPAGMSFVRLADADATGGPSSGAGR